MEWWKSVAILKSLNSILDNVKDGGIEAAIGKSRCLDGHRSDCPQSCEGSPAILLRAIQLSPKSLTVGEKQ